MLITKFLPALFVVFLLLPDAAQATNTANYYKCTYKEGGEWNYGRTPNVCSANAFGSDATVMSDYPHLIFMDTASRTPERSRYVTEMYALVREAAKYYFAKRKPSASAEEIKQWQLLVQLTAAHESRMSHYRRTVDTRLKMMRGDLGHGHGMMQIDDRGHFNAITNGIAWNLITNVTYGMDILYAQWERAPSQSCYKNSSDKYKARIRSAWAAYNGGPGSICRWTNSSSAWAANDKNFLDMYNNHTWSTYLINAQATASVDVACLIENRENCAAPGDDDELHENHLYQRPDKSVCALIGGKFRCVKESRDSICLRALGGVDLSAVTAIDAATAASVPATSEDRHALCEKYDSTLIAVGDYLKTQIAINLRSTPGGGLMKTLDAGQTLQVLDFEIRNNPVNDRYYQVKSGSSLGYIYAGDKGDYGDWAVATAAPVNVPASIIRPGAVLQIVAPAGINQRGTPGGSLIRLIPKNTKLTVIDYVIKGTQNEVYYLVSYSGKQGYIYSGSLLPTDSTSTWTKRAP
jgi:hypothetical protein